MKTVFLFCTLLLSLSTCNQDDKVASQQNNPSFTLVSRSNAFGGSSTEYPSEAIVWTINFNSQKIDVAITGDPTPVYLEAGSYNYELKEHPCNYDDNQFISVGGNDLGVLILDDLAEGTLIITGECYDGDRLTFRRLN